MPNTERFQALGLAPAEILLPNRDVDLKRWAMVACDQYTSQPAYWRDMDAYVGDAPSTLRLIVPEVWLDTPEEEALRRNANAHMEAYLRDGVLNPLPASFIHVRRTTPYAPLRQGLVAAFDLEAYDYSPGSRSLIRSTEDTIAARLPARIAVRSRAALECPHIMILIDDPGHTVIEPLSQHDLPLAYDTPLAGEGGHVRGYSVQSPEAFSQIAAALDALKQTAEPLYAVGDGNHSLAAALECWRAVRPSLSPEARENHPLRYCLAELVNIHDPGLHFYPIHRVVFTDRGAEFLDALARALKDLEGDGEVSLVCGGETHTLRLPQPAALPVQRALDALLPAFNARVDYIHEEDHCRALAQEGNVAVLLPAMDKFSLFPAIRAGGALPRKTFSMGHAPEKRYYFECRALK